MMAATSHPGSGAAGVVGVVLSYWWLILLFHTALGDARWARDIYDAVMGRLP